MKRDTGHTMLSVSLICRRRDNAESDVTRPSHKADSTARGSSFMRRAGTVIWKDIQETIARDIADGVFPAGSRMPVEGELALRFGVNRHTVRRALAGLAERGAISIQPGRGTFVEARLPYPITRRTRFSETLSAVGTRGTLVRAWQTPASERIAADLSLDIGAPLIAFEDLRFIEDVVVSLTTHHFPLPRCEGIVEHFAKTGSVTQALSRLGIADYERTLTRVHCRAATAEESSLLAVSADSSMLVVESVNAEIGGLPIEYGLTRSVGERFELVIKADRM